MNIGIDARLIDETGVGRYIRNLLTYIAVVDKKNDYVIFLRKKNYDIVLPEHFKKVVADVPWHGIREQISMPLLFAKEKLDVVHVPYHNPPIFYFGPMVLTIHDLIILHVNTGKATTLPLFLYVLKRMGYILEMFIGLRIAKKIIAVSNATKNDIVKSFSILPEKILVTYEGVDAAIQSGKKTKRLIEHEYFLYVGNAYPHKNIDTLLNAWEHMEVPLVLVGKEDYFYKKIIKNNTNKNVIFFGYANDEQLYNLYTFAKAAVFPSRIEGFGLPALEALSVGCPVVCSDIPVFHEILGNYATYVNPDDEMDIVQKLTHMKPKNRVPDHFFEKYSWKQMAQKTLEVYESCARL